MIEVPDGFMDYFHGDRVLRLYNSYTTPVTLPYNNLISECDVVILDFCTMNSKIVNELILQLGIALALRKKIYINFSLTKSYRLQKTITDLVSNKSYVHYFESRLEMYDTFVKNEMVSNDNRPVPYSYKEVLNMPLCPICFNPLNDIGKFNCCYDECPDKGEV
jgi:hypothetical protein